MFYNIDCLYDFCLWRAAHKVSPSHMLISSSIFILMCQKILLYLDEQPTTNKLAPDGTGGRLLLTANFKVTWHKNYNKNQKSGPNKL